MPLALLDVYKRQLKKRFKGPGDAAQLQKQILYLHDAVPVIGLSLIHIYMCIRDRLRLQRIFRRHRLCSARQGDRQPGFLSLIHI